MRWPWVSRAGYDRAMVSLRERDDWVAEWRGIATAAEERYTDLLGKYHELKLQGASIPTVPLPMAPRSGDPVLAEILAASGTDRLLRGAMIREATRLRDANFSEQQIIERIQEGTQSLEGLPA